MTKLRAANFLVLESHLIRHSLAQHTHILLFYHASSTTFESIDHRFFIGVTTHASAEEVKKYWEPVNATRRSYNTTMNNLRNPQVSHTRFLSQRSISMCCWSHSKMFVCFFFLVFFCRQICLREAYERRDLGNFIFALECLGADVNAKDEESGKTLFHEILKTPKSGKFIECSIENGADCYSVRLGTQTCYF